MGYQPSTIKHTFVVLAYKESPYLESCIRSIVNQSTKSRVIVSTSTPSPFLSAITGQYGLPLRINRKSEGIAADWNFAFNSAQTPYVTLAHQDDLYAPHYTEIFLHAMRQGEPIIVFCDYRERRKNITRNSSLLLSVKRFMLGLAFFGKSRTASPTLKKGLLISGNPICCPSIMYHKKKIGSFVFDTGFNMNLDWEANLRLAALPGEFVYIRKKLLTRRIHPDSETTLSLSAHTRNTEDLEIIKRYWPRELAILYCRLYAVSHKLN